MDKIYKTVTENTSDLIFATDKLGNFIYVNDAWIQHLGYKREFIHVLNIKDTIHPDYFSSYNQIISKLQYLQKIENIEIPFIKSNGRILIAEGTIITHETAERVYNTIAIFKNVSGKKLAEDKAQLNEERYKAVFEQDFLGMAILDVFGKIQQANRMMSEILEYSLYELQSKNILELTHQDDVEKSAKLNMDLLNLVVKRSNHEKRLVSSSGKIRYGNESLLVVLDSKNNPDYFLLFFEDITEKKLANEKFIEQSAKLRAIFNSSSQSMVTVNQKLEVTSYNQNFASVYERVTGNQPTIYQSIKPIFKEIFGEEHARYFLDMHHDSLQGKRNHFERKINLWNNHHVWIEVYLDPIIIPGRKTEEISYVIHDITEKKNIEEDIKHSLLEKEILLKEVHHRVKNNLQVISSILNLQSNYIRDNDTIEVMREIQNRIKSMALIHENLYQNQDISKLNVSEYIRMLVHNLAHTTTYHPHKVIFDFNLEEAIMLDLDHSIPCGLIINEIVSNACKHAFSDVENPRIEILFRKEKELITLKISDNGKGFPEALNFRDTESLGMQLVMALTDQISGNINMQTAPGKGTSFHITFTYNKK